MEVDLELSEELEADELELELLEPEPDSEPEESEPDSLDRDLLLDCRLLVCKEADEDEFCCTLWLTLLNLLLLFLSDLVSRSDTGLRLEVAWPLSLLLDVLEHVDTGLAALPPLRPPRPPPPPSSLFRYKLEDLTDVRPSAGGTPGPEPGLGDSGASDFQLLLEFRLDDP